MFDSTEGLPKSGEKPSPMADVDEIIRRFQVGDCQHLMTFEATATSTYSVSANIGNGSTVYVFQALPIPRSCELNCFLRKNSLVFNSNLNL